MRVLVAIGVLALGVPALGQAGFECPDQLPGFFPHDVSCDKYWACEEGVATLKTCGNGLAFDDTDPNYEKENCDYLHNVQCGQRTELEPPISSPNCPRQYGIFADEANCNTFWSCWAGEANKYECPPGLAYDSEQRVCVWADQVAACKKSEKEGDFQCPAEGNGLGTYSLYAHQEDCRLYYVCMGGAPREYGCPLGTVFKIGDLDGSGQCADPADVPGCEEYYGDLDVKELAMRALGGGSGTSGRVSKQLEPEVERSSALELSRNIQ
ncbi:Protein obstructor-E [Amphibalanus amphitrite]|uniref:Protein obstructor-E n=1 Tax=Amphibalanus amphitrite TaxID=1232801 RepID=A0A6A4V227_AMPAM|nr:protein obstructor-E-like isoform X1 [Amphibalanus amphitrite]KAF0287645.1 Protein obstructor-E [Amphibalanus amphitrite]KAF0303331.1 Protein obstructor-E [Amphibalanus amphitrite]